jgi:ATP-binding cassette subfamily B (MDR/TAP) protein 1
MLIFAVTSLGSILAYMPQIGSSKDTASRILRLAQLSGKSHEHRGDTRITIVGDIVFNNLRFAYPSRPEQTILCNLSLHLLPGSCTAIVGGSGSGKSTIANLLLKMYSTAASSRTEGGNAGDEDLILGGRNIKGIDTPTLRSFIVPVSQTSTLFSATVADNISYGLPKYSHYNSMAYIMGAAKQAGVHEFICSLPQGYNTHVGDGGMGVSGGQAQRIAIARALVRRPAVLILDEATSALDFESANLVRQTVENLVNDQSRTMTVIIITHSREMMEIAEDILVLDKGMIVEQGEFDELLAKNGALTNLLTGGEWTGPNKQQATLRSRRVPVLKDVEWKKRRKGKRAG